MTAAGAPSALTDLADGVDGVGDSYNIVFDAGGVVAKKTFVTKIPRGQRLIPSRSANGAVRGMLFDKKTNKLVGQAEFFEKAGRGRGLGGGLVTRVVVGAVVSGVSAATPVILERIAEWRAQPSSEDYEDSAEIMAAADAGADASHAELVAAVATQREQMSSAEALDRFIAAYLAREFSDQQLRILLNADIQGEVDLNQLQERIAELSPAEVGDLLTQMLRQEQEMLTSSSADAQNLEVPSMPATHLAPFAALPPPPGAYQHLLPSRDQYGHLPPPPGPPPPPAPPRRGVPSPPPPPSLPGSAF